MLTTTLKSVSCLQMLCVRVSKDGVITIEESKTRETSIGVVEGMQFDVVTSLVTS